LYINPSQCQALLIFFLKIYNSKFILQKADVYIRIKRKSILKEKQDGTDMRLLQKSNQIFENQLVEE